MFCGFICDSIKIIGKFNLASYDSFRGTERTYLSRIECASAGACYSVRTCNLTDCEKPANAAFPIAVDRNSAVTMLCAKRYFEVLFGEINALA